MDYISNTKCSHIYEEVLSYHPSAWNSLILKTAFNNRFPSCFVWNNKEYVTVGVITDFIKRTYSVNAQVFNRNGKWEITCEENDKTEKLKTTDKDFSALMEIFFNRNTYYYCLFDMNEEAVAIRSIKKDFDFHIHISDYAFYHINVEYRIKWAEIPKKIYTLKHKK